MKRIEKVNVLILFEHTVRELEAVCLLKKEFEKRGYSVKIIGIYPNKERIPVKFSADYIFIPWAYRSTEYIQCFLKNSPNAVFINLHWEEYTTVRNRDFLLPKENAKLVCHVSWGEKFTDSLEKIGCKNIFTVGSIRLDFYKHSLNKWFLSKQSLATKYGLDEEKRWVMFIADGAHLVESYISNIPQSERDNLPQCKNRKFFLDSVEKYLEKNRETIFIYRPHPSFANKELNREDLLRIKDRYPNNFYIISKESIGNWIVNCDSNISFQSTSVIDCICANSPFYLLRNTDIDYSADYEFFHGYPYVIRTYEDFLAALNSTDYDNSKVRQLFKAYYVLKDEFSYVNLVSQVLSKKLPKLELPFNTRHWKKNAVKACFKDIVIKLSKRKTLYCLMRLFKDNRLQRIIGPSDDLVTDNQIQLIEEKLRRIEETDEMV